MHSILDAYEKVKRRIAEAARRAGRDPQEVELVAVSKTWPAETVAELAHCGHRLFGENRVQEIEAKVPALQNGLIWHFIGHLQKNKVRKVLPLADVIHSIDSLDLARRTDAIAAEIGLFPKVYLQVNAAAEASKFGFSPETLRSEFETLLDLERIEILGLMTIPPAVKEREDARPHFVALRELRDQLQVASGLPLPGLSMGMSHDFEIAIEEGATLVRVGSAIFGPRRSFRAES